MLDEKAFKPEYINAVYDMHPYIIVKGRMDGDDFVREETPYCHRCGNLANAIAIHFRGFDAYFTPYCKVHIQELEESDLGYIRQDRKIWLNPDETIKHKELCQHNGIR